MLNKMPLKLASLALGLMLVAGCQHQGAGQSSAAVNAEKPAASTAQRGAESGQQAGQQAEQNILTVHLAQLEAEPELLVLELGEGKRLYALPEPVLNQGDMLGVASVANEEGQTFLLFEMTEEGKAKLANISSQATGHFFLFSAKGQLVGVSQIAEPVTDGNLVMATENQEHTDQVLQLLR